MFRRLGLATILSVAAVLRLAFPHDAAATSAVSPYTPAPNLASFNVREIAGMPAAIDQTAAAFAEVHFAFTVAPAHSVVENQPVELRANVYTTSTQPVGINLQYYASGNSGYFALAASAYWLVLQPHTQYLVTFWYVPGMAGYLGNVTFYALAQQSASAWKSLTWPVDVFPTQPLFGGVTNAFPAFHVVWIEPGALAPGVVLRRHGPVTAAAYTDYITQLHERGVGTLVLAYSQSVLGDVPCAFYTRRDYSGLPFCNAGIPYDVVEQTLARADALGMKVIVGLGQAGGDTFTLELASYYGQHPSVFPNLSPALAAKKAHILELQTRIAQDIWRHYGKRHASFYGFYLGLESNCHDQVTTHNYNPLAATLRRLSGADKVLMVSPPLLDKACTRVSQSLRDLILQTDADIIAYQDGAGAGTVINLGTDGVRSNDDLTLNTFNAQNTLNTYIANFTWLMLQHQHTGRHIWSNIETWRMTGPTYSAVDASTGASYQLDAQVLYASLYVGQLMLNEGTRYFYAPGSPLTLADGHAAQTVSQAWYGTRGREHLMRAP